MRTVLTAGAVAGCLACAGCGNEEGIVVAASTDPATVTLPLDELLFLIGVDDGTGTFVKDAEQQPDVPASVSGRNLETDPYKLLLRDGSDGDPSTVLVAVVGYRGSQAVAFGAFDAPQTFMPDSVIRRDVVVAADAGFEITDTGCATWGDNQIVAPDDRDCDGDPSDTDCDDADPARSSEFEEICDNGIDDDCDAGTPDDCAGECTVAQDCEDANGPPPCGAWQCNDSQCDVICEDCDDGDLDGYGTGAGCAGPDCDDADDTLGADGSRLCYSGPDGTEGVGACQAGLQSCTAGVLGPCTGEVTPSGEACNDGDDDCDGSVDEALGQFTCGLGECETSVAACTGGTVGVCIAGAGAASDADCDGADDDCDGAIDEDCPACARVSNAGNDTLAVTDGNVTPFATIQAAINWAAGDAARPRIVCVAPGAACGATATFSGAVTMADGISVYGGYRSSDWLRCASSTTNVATGTATGVLFGDEIASPTVLDGVRILRFGAATTAGVTVDGAKSVILSSLTIDTEPDVTNSYGINAINGAEVLVTGSNIRAGNAIVESAAVRSVASKLTIRDNCASLDGLGRCDDDCFTATNPGLRARFFPVTSGGSYGALLIDSPGAVVDTSSFCGGATDRSAAVRVTGESAGVVIRANDIQTFGGLQEAYGVWAEDCAGAAPWIVDNNDILAAGETPTALVAGIKAVGDCHPVIDSNVQITGGAEGGTVATNGVHCTSQGGIPSRCVVLGNQRVQGSAFGFPPSAVGVRCDDGACNRIAGNTIVGNTGVLSYGMWLERTGAFVDDNDITGGCATTKATGVHADDAWARIQNNRIHGGGCEGSAGVDFVGVSVSAASGGNEVDVHSNTIDGDGAPVACTSRGIVLDAAAGGLNSPAGIFRNNIVRAGRCATSIGVEEHSAASDPRVFENNDLDPFNTPNALYVDEGSSMLQSAAAVNALTDATLGGNISADPMFASYPSNLHINAGSACIGAGTPAGAPTGDMDGDVRDLTTPDIGADEQ